MNGYELKLTLRINAPSQSGALRVLERRIVEDLLVDPLADRKEYEPKFDLIVANIQKTNALIAVR